MVRFFFHFKYEVNILCKVEPIQVYNSIMRKKHKWMDPVVLFSKMSFGSVVVGGMMEPIDVRKEFLSRSYILRLKMIN